MRPRLALLGLIAAAGLGIAAKDAVPDLRYIAATFTKPMVFTGSGDSITATRIRVTGGATGTDNEFVYFGITGPVGVLTDAYMGLGTFTALTSNDLQWPIVSAGTIQEIRGYLVTGPDSGAAETVTFTVQINGVDSAMSQTVSGTGPSSFNSTGNQITISSGDRLSLHVSQSAATALTANVALHVKIYH